jgi:hypothetical protein
MLGTLPWRHERQFVGTGSPPPSYLQGVRSGATLFLFAAVGILAALALADALRPKDDSRPAAGPATTSATSTRREPPTLLDTLRDEAVSGFVLYSDQDCRLHSLLLPRMVDDVVRDEGGGDVFHCRFDIDGGRIVPGGISAAGTLAVRKGQIVSGDRVVLTHEDLVRAARRHPNLFDLDRSVRRRIKVTGLASFGVQKPVVAMDITVRDLPDHQWLVALFDGHDVRAVAASFRGPYRDLFTSNDGALVGAEDGTVITRTGRTIDPPQGVPASRAIAFSPDDRWVVRVNGTSIFLVGPPEGDQTARIIRLPIPARDLVWEPATSATSVGPPIRR